MRDKATKPREDQLLPLKPVVFHVLLSLADGERHGYGIVQDIAQRSAARMRLEPGNLYRSLKSMLEDGLIEESERRPASDLGDERRRYYRVTRLGAGRGRRGRTAPGARGPGAGAVEKPGSRMSGNGLYSRLLALYPRAFRRRFGQDMAELFRDLRRHEAQERGGRGVARLWLRTVFGLLLHAPVEHGSELLRRLRGEQSPTERAAALAASRKSGETMRGLGQDVRFAVRTVGQAAGFHRRCADHAGAWHRSETALFSVVDAALLRPLPFPDPQRLVWVYETDANGHRDGVSPPTWRICAAAASSTESPASPRKA